MIEPRRAIVRPRIVSPETGEAMLLEEEIRALVERRERQEIWLVGPAGSGKTTALSHLAAVFPADQVCCARAAAAAPVAVFAARTVDDRERTVWRMADWGDDELIEYLLSAHFTRCGSVMGRLREASDADLPEGNPGLWRAVLDALAEDETLTGPTEFLRRRYAERFPDRAARRQVGRAALMEELRAPAGAPQSNFGQAPADVAEMLAVPGARRVFACEYVVEDVRSGSREALLLRWTPPIVQYVAAALREDERALARLRHYLTSRKSETHAMAASVLHAAGRGWLPPRRQRLVLTGAYLSGAQLAGEQLSHARLSGADLSRAKLCGALLRRGNLSKADFRGADLSGAKLEGATAVDACFEEANLSAVAAPHADFTGARLRGANLERADLGSVCLRRADLRDANLRGADLRRALLWGARLRRADLRGADLSLAELSLVKLRGARLSGACLESTRLRECNLEGIRWADARLKQADLTRAALTGAWMPGANLNGATLRGAELADVVWEKADLRDADFQGASFHLGSSRSGLVGSPLASEGSRTGFYTDEETEQHFRAAEEIRKANLRGADLRGASVLGCDFYLVDLRDARYDSAQEKHFRGCRAILHDGGA